MADVISSFKSLSTKMQELATLEMDRLFSDMRLLAENTNVKVYAATRLDSGSSVALKCVQKETTKKTDFLREFYCNSYLSPHPNIVTCYDEAYATEAYYAFAQELAPVGDMSKHVKRGGVGDKRAKRVVEQVVFALEYIHKKELVHRDVCLENIFIFDHGLSRVKLGDFGNAERVGAFVKKLKVRSPWAPPEVSLAVYNEGYYVHSAQDAWQLGILIFVCLTGSYPWSSADITDRHYKSWVAWLKRKTTKMPPRFKCFTPRLLRLLRRLLEPKPEKRYGVEEVYKYLSDPWLLQVDHPGISFDKCSSDIWLGQMWSLQRLVEKKMVDLLHSYLTQPEPVKKESRRCVRFAAEVEAIDIVNLV
ncbi:serine/threonine-protein kinase SBK1-like [Panulirus ornatus]|uniref:serine/threonine-protein kinase SBK1-like n=1 Tax=Panulirus ornatus TaxID=150431 RepID=UPI003A83F4CB